LARGAGTVVVTIVGDVKDLQKKLGAAEASIAKTGSRMFKGLTLPLLALGGMATKAAVDFETAFTGVRKTVDGTEAQFAQLEKGIREMAKTIPASAVSIAQVAENAGQLGIAADNILGFSRVMIDLGNTTNLAADEAASALARLANITKMPQNEFDRLGATIVALGNAGASTEAEIVELAMRLAGAGAQIGLTQPQILGFANALSSLGVEAESGGTAMSTTFSKIANAAASGGKSLDLFAKVAGVSSDAFKKQFKDDAAGAIVTFIEGLGDLKDSGVNLFPILDKLGLGGLRVRDALLRSANSGDLMRASLELGTKAWRDNSALTTEAAKRYETLQSKMQIAKQKVTDMGISVGNVLAPIVARMAEGIGRLADRFQTLSPGMQKMIIATLATVAAVGPAIVVAMKFAVAIKTVGLATTGWIGLIVLLGVAVWKFRDKLQPVFAFITRGAANIVNVWRVVVNALLSFFGLILKSASKAWGWIPGVGPKLRKASSEFESFRASANRSLAGIRDRIITIGIKTSVSGPTGPRLPDGRFSRGDRGVGPLLPDGRFSTDDTKPVKGFQAAVSGITERLSGGGRSGAGFGGGGGGGKRGGGGGGGGLSKAVREFQKAQTAIVKAQQAIIKHERERLKQAVAQSKAAQKVLDALNPVRAATSAIFNNLFEALNSVNLSGQFLTVHLEHFGSAIKGAQSDIQAALPKIAAAVKANLLSPEMLARAQALDATAAQLQKDIEDLNGRMSAFNSSVLQGFDRFGQADGILAAFGAAVEDGMIDPLSSAVDWLRNQTVQAESFAAALSDLATKGLDPGLLSQIAAQGPAALGLLQALRSASPEVIATMNKAEQDLAAARNKLILDLDEKIFGTAMQEITKRVYEFQGAVLGLNDAVLAATQRQVDVAAATVAAMKAIELAAQKSIAAAEKALSAAQAASEKASSTGKVPPKGAAVTTAKAGPVVHIENYHAHDEADIEALQRRTAFAQRAFG
jgi:TP901 family phage tail tape measure protein